MKISLIIGALLLFFFQYQGILCDDEDAFPSKLPHKIMKMEESSIEPFNQKTSVSLCADRHCSAFRQRRRNKQLMSPNKPSISSGVVPGGKSLERRGMKRLQQVLHQLNTRQDSTKRAVRRHFLRRGDAKHTTGFFYQETNDVPKESLEKAILDAIAATEQALRRTEMALDTIKALRRQGRTLHVLVD